MTEPKVVHNFPVPLAERGGVDKDGNYYELLGGEWHHNLVTPRTAMGLELARLTAELEEKVGMIRELESRWDAWEESHKNETPAAGYKLGLIHGRREGVARLAGELEKERKDFRAFIVEYDRVRDQRNYNAARVEELEELGDAGAFRELADAHNELRDHNTALLAEIKRQEGWVKFYQDLQGKSEAENQRLREALDSIAVNAKDGFAGTTADNALEEKP